MPKLKKRIAGDIARYLDIEVVDRLENIKISQRGLKSLQEALEDIFDLVGDLDEKNKALEEELKIAKEVLAKYQRRTVRQNEEAERTKKEPGVSRNEKIWKLKLRGFSQRQIAEEMGISRPRVQQILNTGNPLSNNDDFLDAQAIKMGIMSREERDRKIREWRAEGVTQKEIAEETGLSQARVSQVESTSCTQVQKNYIDQKKKSKNFKKDSFHRNTRTKIEQIRKVAPKLAKKCENREISVRAAYSQVEGDLYRVGLKRLRN